MLPRLFFDARRYATPLRRLITPQQIASPMIAAAAIDCFRYFLRHVMPLISFYASITHDTLLLH